MRSRLPVGSLMAMLVLIGMAALLGGGPEKEPTPEEIAALVKQLGDDNFFKREEAGKSLQEAGEISLPALKVAAKSDDLEVRRRAENLILRIMLACRKSKSTGLELALVEPGEFQMGSPNNEASRRPDEATHNVRITKPFLLGVYEVTQDEYAKVMEVSPSHFSAKGPGKEKVGGMDTARFPVEKVTWFDALEFCNRLSKKDGYEPFYKLTDVKRDGDSIVKATVTVAGGNGFRLPTEAEWEFACRNGVKGPYHYGAAGNGNSSNVKGETYSGGYGGTVVGPNLTRTARVGSYKANSLGLYDMHGNAGEWCWDWYDKDYYANSPADDPQGPDKGTQRVQRGGSWLLPEGSARAASRAGQTPDERKEFAGFRVARTP